MIMTRGVPPGTRSRLYPASPLCGLAGIWKEFGNKSSVHWHFHPPGCSFFCEMEAKNRAGRLAIIKPHDLLQDSQIESRFKIYLMVDEKKKMYTETQWNETQVDGNGRAMVWEPKTRVVLADDHDVVRKGIRNLLRKAADIVVIGEANNGAEAIRLINQLHPDVLLLDIEMPGMTGVDVIRRLDEAGVDIRILVLSAYDDQEYILEMLGSGASGYLLKEETPEYILDAVRGVANGQRGWVSDRVARKLQQLQQTRRMDSTLTFMEMDILRLIAEEKSDEEISSALDLEPGSLDKIIRFLLKKLGVNNREQAVEIARQQSWI